MNCEQLRDDYEFYALGLLEPADTSEINDHLARRCPKCEAGIRAAVLLNANILTLVPEASPSRQLRRKVLAGFGIETETWGWTIGWAAATACLVAATLWFSLIDRRQIAELDDVHLRLANATSSLNALQQAVQFLNQPETRQVGFGKGEPKPPRGNVFVNPDSGVLLIASNLPQAPAGKAYQLWIIPKGVAPKPSGMFQSDLNGGAVYIAPGRVDVASTGAVAVTLEPELGSPAPTTKPIIVAAVAGP